MNSKIEKYILLDIAAKQQNQTLTFEEAFCTDAVKRLNILNLANISLNFDVKAMTDYYYLRATLQYDAQLECVQSNEPFQFSNKVLIDLRIFSNLESALEYEQLIEHNNSDSEQSLKLADFHSQNKYLVEQLIIDCIALSLPAYPRASI